MLKTQINIHPTPQFVSSSCLPGGVTPIVSIAAVREFLVKGDVNALRSYMKEIGATVAKNSASSTQVHSLQYTAE
jgi:hypothetical protein